MFQLVFELCFHNTTVHFYKQQTPEKNIYNLSEWKQFRGILNYHILSSFQEI